jgi:hypothetical protein
MTVRGIAEVEVQDNRGEEDNLCHVSKMRPLIDVRYKTA